MSPAALARIWAALSLITTALGVGGAAWCVALLADGALLGASLTAALSWSMLRAGTDFARLTTWTVREESPRHDDSP
jgi:hypothetical protein